MENSNPPKIEIRVGSDSDLPKISAAFSVLKSLKIPFSVRILSAHRTPAEMTHEAQNLEKNGFGVCIAAAGGSAHLAGMTASETARPVVALPVKSSGGGLESLCSMLQMPPGIPNACTGIGAAETAAVLAVRAAYFLDGEIREKLAAKIGKNLVGNLSAKTPKINILTSDPNLNFPVAENLGLQVEINKKIESGVLVISMLEGEAEKISRKNSDLIDYFRIWAPRSAAEIFWAEVALQMKFDGASVGFGRAENAILLACQIWGNFDKSVLARFKNYRAEISAAVRKKDAQILELGVESFLPKF